VRISVIAVGRMRSAPERALFERYRDRITWPLDLREVEDRRSRAADERRRREAVLLLDAVPAGATIVALDGDGRTIDSAAFAEVFATWRDDGRRNVAFLIGGAEGLDPSVRETADLVLSLGPMTWPHLLARVLLMEQIFRAQCILAGHPYHRAYHRA
jgi:23S rRNA (pseudouridine1915-N3)-methyltransferase